MLKWTFLRVRVNINRLRLKIRKKNAKFKNKQKKTLARVFQHHIDETEHITQHTAWCALVKWVLLF